MNVFTIVGDIVKGKSAILCFIFLPVLYIIIHYITFI